MPLRKITLARLDMTREINDRMCGTREIAATKDGRVMIRVAIDTGADSVDGTFDPQFAMSVGMELMTVAMEALRNATNRAVEDAIARAP